MSNENTPNPAGAPAAAAPSVDDIARSYIDGRYGDASVKQANMALRFARTAAHVGEVPARIDEFMQSFGAGGGQAGGRGHDGRFASAPAAAPAAAGPVTVATPTNTGPAATNTTAPALPANPALWPADVVARTSTKAFMEALNAFEAASTGKAWNPYRLVPRAHEKKG